LDFIFMLTRDDQTVEDCLSLVDEIAPVGLKHIGFKDIGVDFGTLRRLNAAIHATGATSYMEVVSTSHEAELRSIAIAHEIGVDRLLGGTAVADALETLGGSLSYYPFPGRPSGHPTRLGGTPAEIEADAARFVALGCAGCDLLAYRATEADPLDLVRAARRGLGTGTLIVAGSVAGKDRVRALAEAGADAFTIGTAVFNGVYSPRKGSIRSQLRDILADCEAA
jgi:hypothetical protein